MGTVKHLLESKKSNAVWTISPDDSVYDALLLMSEKNIGALVVLKGKDICGVMSERDYARKIILNERSSRSTRVSEIMSTEVYTISANRTLDECMALMTNKRIRHLPVLEAGELKGLISIGDIVAATIAHKDFLIDELTNYITNARQVEPTKKVVNA